MNLCITSILLAFQEKLSQTTLTEETKSPLIETAAVTIVDTTTEYIKLPGHAPFSEPSAYALFVGTLCLIAIASDMDESDERDRLEHKIVGAFFLMSRIACPKYAATSVYLNHIYVSFCVGSYGLC